MSSKGKQKIGIVTFWNSSDNYGQQLQCFALQYFLREELGHSPYLIRYSHLNAPSKPKKKPPFLLRWLGYLTRPIRNPKRFIVNSYKKLQKKKVRKFKQKHADAYSEFINTPRHFDKFRNKFLTVSPQEYPTFEELSANPPAADAYICGSDQVWNKYALPDYPANFLEFAPEGSKRISYAPSFGANYLPENVKEIIRPSLAKFSLITVREESGIPLCAEMGRDDALLAPDPTLLLTQKDYEQAFGLKDNSDSEKYVFVYLLGNEINFNIDEIYKYAKAKNLKVKYVASQERYDTYPKIYPRVEEWVGLMRNAECVITNSFHGMVFAIIFQRRFFVIPCIRLAKNMNTRLYSMLDLLGIENRIWSGKMSILDEEIDYTEPMRIIAEKREEIKELLSCELNK